MRSLLKYLLNNTWAGLLILVCILVAGYWASPFVDQTSCLFCNSVKVDALPEMGANQQIVFAEWLGQDSEAIDNMLAKPLSLHFTGVPGLKTVRSHAMAGHCSIYLIFEENIDFWSARKAVTDRFEAIEPSNFPPGVALSLGPPSTATGQIFWYTLEGRAADGSQGGLDEYSKYNAQVDLVGPMLDSIPGVAEVAAIGAGPSHFMVMPRHERLLQKGIQLQALQDSLVKAQKSIASMQLSEDEKRSLMWRIPVGTFNGAQVELHEVAELHKSYPHRHSILMKSGVLAVGGVLSLEKGADARQVLDAIHAKVAEINARGLIKTYVIGRQKEYTLQIIPFYDRSTFIEGSLSTLSDSLGLEILVTLIVILILAFNFRESILITGMLPLAVLFCFAMMKILNWEANIVALSGIAIAIGTMVDMAIVIQENIEAHLKKHASNPDFRAIILEACLEVNTAVFTAVATTILSFLPIFFLSNSEGQLFQPLAFTKTFALLGALLISVFLLPMLNVWVIANFRGEVKFLRRILPFSVIGIVVSALFFGSTYFIEGLIFVLSSISILALAPMLKSRLSMRTNPFNNSIFLVLLILGLAFLFGKLWMPLGAASNLWLNVVVSGAVIGFMMLGFWMFMQAYPLFLRWSLRNKGLFLMLPLLAVFSGLLIWQGFAGVFGGIAGLGDALGLHVKESRFWDAASTRHPGMAGEFMPPMDEGDLLLMPTLPATASMSQIAGSLKAIELRLQAIPELELIVGKAGRARSALDPAPLNMLEIMLRVKPEYAIDSNGNVQRQWRSQVHNKKELHEWILRAAYLPKVNNSPILQPIETRLLMLQTGVQARMAIKILGQDAQAIAQFAHAVAEELAAYAGLQQQSIFVDEAIAEESYSFSANPKHLSKFGITIGEIESQVASKTTGLFLEDLSNSETEFNIMVRDWNAKPKSYAELAGIPIILPSGSTLPLDSLVELKMNKAPKMLRRENGALVSYVLFEKEPGRDDRALASNLKTYLEEKIRTGAIKLPNDTHFSLTGDFENEIRAKDRLKILIPISILLIFMILYLQFRSFKIAGIVLSGVLVAFSGGFWMLWLYAQPWWLDFGILNGQIRDALAVEPVNLSIAVWVGFIALFGIATEDGVVLGTYIQQMLNTKRLENVADLHERILEAGQRRIRPCLMTVATTLIALLPILTSTGQGADIMRPMAIPLFGGMTMALLTLFVVPVLYAALEERKLKRRKDAA